MKPVLVILAMLLVSCAAEPAKTPQGIRTASNGIASIGTDLDRVDTGIKAAKPHADAVGQAHLDDASSATADAKLKAGDASKGVEQANEQIGVLSKQVDALKADNSSNLHKAYAWSGICGLFIAAGGFAAFYSGIKPAQYVGIGGIIVTLGGTALSLIVQAVSQVLPWMLGGVGVITFGAIVWSLIKHKGSLAEVVSDIAIHREPTVPYTATTQALVRETSGIVAASPTMPVSPLAAGYSINVKPST